MTRFEYIEALRKALEGLPPDVIARTVADYEKRIYDASAAGQSEDEILAGLEDPQQVADSLRAPPAPKLPAVATAPQPNPNHSRAAAQGPASALRMAVSFVGLMVFNLFLIVPAIAYAGLLIAAFAVSLACYVGGIAMTGASVAGVNQFSLDEPFDHMNFHKPDVVTDLRSRDGRTMVKIGENGIHVEAGDKRIHVEPRTTGDAPMAAANAGSASASASTPSSTPADGNTTVDIGPKGIVVKDGNDESDVDIDIPGLHIHDNDMDIDKGSFTLGTDFISESRPVQVSVGIGIILAGIIGFLLCLAVARYTMLGIARLAQLEFSVLRGA